MRLIWCFSGTKRRQQWSLWPSAVFCYILCDGFEKVFLYPTLFRRKTEFWAEFFSAVSFLFAVNGVFPVLQVPHRLFLVTAHFYKNTIVAGLRADFRRPDLIIIIKVVVVLEDRQHRNHLAHLPRGSVIRASN